jgi:hypothetical protein
MKRFRIWLMDVCWFALYLMVMVPPWWMANSLAAHSLDKYGIGLLGGLPAMAVAFAAAFGLLVLAQKARRTGEHMRRRWVEQQLKRYDPSAALVDWAAKYGINARDDRVLGEFRDLHIRYNHLPTDTEAAYRRWIRGGSISLVD